MATGTQGAGAHWSGFTGDALKVAELLVKLKFTEAVTNSIVGNGIDIGEEIEHLDDDMCNIFSQTSTIPVLSNMGWLYP